jgi:hypothetical protein
MASAVWGWKLYETRLSLAIISVYREIAEMINIIIQTCITQYGNKLKRIES